MPTKHFFHSLVACALIYSHILLLIFTDVPSSSWCLALNMKIRKNKRPIWKTLIHLKSNISLLFSYSVLVTGYIWCKVTIDLIQKVQWLNLGSTAVHVPETDECIRSLLTLLTATCTAVHYARFVYRCITCKDWPSHNFYNHFWTLCS